MLAVSAAPLFSRVAKRPHVREKKVLDEAVKAVLSNPQIGEEKKGDLPGVLVHKFKLNSQETSLACDLRPHKNAPTEVMLLAVGLQENFYADLKR